MIGLFSGCRRDTPEKNAKNAQPIQLITPDLSNFDFNPDRWTYQDGIITRIGQGELHDLWLKQPYGDFIITLDYKIDPASNSGVYIRCTDKADWMHTALEVQIHETGDGTIHGQCAGVYDCFSPNFIDVAHLNAVAPDGTATDLAVVPDKVYEVAASQIKITRVYRNLRKIQRNGKVVAYEGSDTGWNPALNVSVLTGQTEQTLLLEKDLPAKASNTDLTLAFVSEKRIPEKDVPTPAGQWHSMKITVDDNIIRVESNGRQALDMNLDQWTEPGWNPDGTKNKYAVPLKDMPRKGFIGFQDHGLPVSFRNITLTPLDGS
jgi:hypothetical protein